MKSCSDLRHQNHRIETGTITVLDLIIGTLGLIRQGQKEIDRRQSSGRKLELSVLVVECGIIISEFALIRSQPRSNRRLKSHLVRRRRVIWLPENSERSNMLHTIYDITSPWSLLL